MRRRSRNKQAAGVVVAGLALLGCAKTDSAQGGSAVPTPAADAALRVPLAGSLPAHPLSVALASGSWAIVPMGNLQQADNTFWQLFASPAPGSPWSLVTPQGVADNGGLAIAAGQTEAVVGFDGSQDLGFSPLASTVNEGKSWSPAVLPRTLTPVPDALAAESGGHVLALLGKAGSTIFSSENGGTSSRYWGSSLQVASASRQTCHVIALTAIAYGAGALPVAGAECEASANVGVYQRYLDSWQAIGGPVPATALAITGSKAGSATEVVRVWASGTTMMGLAAAVSSGGTSCLFGFRRTADGTWTTSPVFAMQASQHLVATGYGPDGSVFLLISNGRSLIAEVLSATTGSWSRLAPPPAGTETLVLAAGGPTEAFVVDKARLTIDALSAGGSWVQRQVVHVPIQLGSSS